MVKIYYAFVDKTKSREMLSYCLKLHGFEGEIKTGENGKPYADGIYFNISHSGDICMIAVSDSEVGLDVEYVTPRDWQKLYERYYTTEERARVSSLEGFLVLWTKKESLIKYLGKTLGDTVKASFENGISYEGKAIEVNSISSRFDDYIFTLTTKEEDYEKLLLM